ncbi:MAG: hypothetical protein F6K31_34695 [Symploca sp. SIO2G7]|nr:hypothetical protein [Symploca sp. SIO2G7]
METQVEQGVGNRRLWQRERLFLKKFIYLLWNWHLASYILTVSHTVNEFYEQSKIAEEILHYFSDIYYISHSHH